VSVFDMGNQPRLRALRQVRLIAICHSYRIEPSLAI